MRQSKIGSRLLSGAFWSLTGAAVSRLCNLIAIVIVARMLGKELFGEFGVVRSTLNMFVAIAGAGLGLTATRFLANFKDKDKTRAGDILSMSFVVALTLGSASAILLLTFSDWLATSTLKAPHLGPHLRAATIFIFLACLDGVHLGALAGFESFQKIAKVKVITGLFTLPAMIFGAWQFEVLGAIWALNLCMLVSLTLNHLTLRKELNERQITLRLRNWRRELEVLWTFSLPAAVATMMYGPVFWTCNAILVNQENGYSEAGLFAAAMTFNALLLFVGGAMNAPLLAMVSEGENENNLNLEKLNMLASWMIGSVVAIPMLCFPEIPTSIFGSDFDGIAFRRTFNFVVVFSCIMLYKQGLFRVLAAKKLMWFSILSNGTWAIALLTSAWFLARAYGASGLAISFTLAYIINVLVFIPLYTKRKLVPPGTIASWQALGIWAAILCCAVTSIFEVPVAARLVLFVAASATVFFLFRQLVRR